MFQQNLLHPKIEHNIVYHFEDQSQIKKKEMWREIHTIGPGDPILPELPGLPSFPWGEINENKLDQNNSTLI